MFFLLLISTVISTGLTSTAAHAEWVEFSSSPGRTYYYDPETLDTVRNPRAVILIDYKDKKNKKDKIRSEIAKYEASCKFRQLRALSSKMFDDEMGTGKLLSSKVQADNWGYPPGETPFEAIYKLLCAGKV